MDREHSPDEAVASRSVDARSDWGQPSRGEQPSVHLEPEPRRTPLDHSWICGDASAVVKEDWVVRAARVGGLDAEFQAVTRKFASSLVVVVKQAALEAVAEVMKAQARVPHDEPDAPPVEEAHQEPEHDMAASSVATVQSRPGRAAWVPVTDRVLSLVRAQPGRRSQGGQEAIGLDRVAVREVLDVLLAEGRIMKEGKGGGTTYRLKSETAALHDEPVVPEAVPLVEEAVEESVPDVEPEPDGAGLPRESWPDRPSTGAKKGTTSSYSGVTLFSNQRKYQAFVRVARKRIHLGMWSKESDAALARDRGALFFGLDGPLNLPEESNRLGPASPDDLRQVARRSTKETGSTSPYFGVTWDPRRRRWAAIICPGERKKIQIAQFDRAEDAAVAYDRVARSMFGDKALVNFPESTLPAASMQEIRAWARLLLKSRPTGKPGLVDPKVRPDDAATRAAPDQIAGPPPSRPAEREPTDGAVDRVLFFIRAKPGLRSEEIRAALGLEKDDMQKAVALLLGEGKIVKEGELRGTRYRPG
jgi:hypothetical protein